MRGNLTHEELTNMLSYNRDTGSFIWKISPSNKIKTGSIAGNISKRGYRKIQMKGKLFRANKLAWFYVTGEWPSNFIDHENCDATDDSFRNLREATSSQNGANRRNGINNSSGYKGVSFDKNTGLWRAQIMVRKKTIHLGSHVTPELAHQAYCLAAKSNFKEFARAA